MRYHIPIKKSCIFYFFWIIVLAFATMPEAQATHIRAGEILARPDSITFNIRRVFFKLVVFYDVAQTNAVNREATLFFGDGSKATVVRTPENGQPTRDRDTWRSVYYFDHTYAGPGVYQATYTELNRAIGVMNIANSLNQTFLLQTTIAIGPDIGINSSPELQVPPIDYAACSQVFVHNPGAYDRDGDILKFRLAVPLRNASTPESPVAAIVTGHRNLNDPSFGCPAVPGGGASTLTMDPNTGQLTWNAPCLAGDYNVAFVIEEYRNGQKIGEVLRDMQVRVKCTPNKRPTLRVPRDTCVVAGSTVIGKVTATDPDNDPVLLEIFTGAIKMPPATFTRSGGGTTGTFTWPTTCNDVRKEPYQVIFKVTDEPKQGVPLTDIQPWNIKVIGPAPEMLTVTPLGKTMVLNWNLYSCQNASKIMIYRHEGPSSFVPGPCETGIPESAGFVKVGEVDKGVVTFTDNGGTAGLKRGVTYCYSIYATFPYPREGEGIAAIPVCVMLENNVPVLTNVSVQTTDVTNGSILVRWTQPREGLQSLVTPLQYRLSRAPGGSPQNFTEVFRSNNLADTTFIDTNISTTAGAGDIKWIYKIELFQNGGATAADLIDNSPTASSVQLKATPRATSIALNWTYNVPWDNSQRRHYIYRKQNNAYVLIDSVSAGKTAGQYVDRGTFQNTPLVPNLTYCYQILTKGVYGNAKLKLKEPLLNFSQEFCTSVKDSIAPCPPILSIDALDCETFLQSPAAPPYQNVLTWVPKTDPGCDQDIAYYTIYYRPNEEGEFDSIAFTNANVTTYTHQNLTSFAGCYVVTATDEVGNESAVSNTVCKDNCFFFKLPNIFTPNGDGKNDTFKPDPRSQFVKSIKFKVFSRWGDKIYEGSEDPAINWKGVNSAGKEVAAGTYYYLAEVEFFTLNPSEANKTYKGWVEIVR